MSNLCIVKLVDRLDIVQKKKGKKKGAVQKEIDSPDYF